MRALHGALTARNTSLDFDAVRNQLVLDEDGPADIAFPVHRLAKATGVAAPALAAELAGQLPPITGLRPAEASGPYVNFHTDPGWLASTTLSMVRSLGARYGHLESGRPSVCVEHTSANPTGPFHIGRVRNAIIGDTLARVLRASGAPVTTQYYVDDVGRQSAMVTWIWSIPPDRWPEEVRKTVSSATAELAESEKPDLRFGRPYPAVSAYLKEHPEAREEVGELSARLERGDAPARHHELAEAILGGMLASLARLSIRFDEFVWESRFITNGSVEKAIARLRAAPHAVREPNGAWAIDTSGYGLPKESARIIVTRGDGTSLYPTRDIAYHLEKLGRFVRVVDVLGQDHLLHARSLEAMLNEIGEKRRPEFVIYQYVTAPGGKAMSTRRGTAVYLDDLLEEAVHRARAEVEKRRTDLKPEEVESIADSVAAGAVRYNVVRVAPEKVVQFSWEEALSFEGRSGPFLQYAYARASSILRKAESRGSPPAFSPDELQTEFERRLIDSVSRLPMTVAYVARTAHVHTLASYAHGLAEVFNRFYQEVPVLSAEKERSSRLALVEAVRQTLGNALDLLGVQPLERM